MADTDKIAQYLKQAKAQVVKDVKEVFFNTPDQSEDLVHKVNVALHGKQYDKNEPAPMFDQKGHESISNQLAIAQQKLDQVTPEPGKVFLDQHNQLNYIPLESKDVAEQKPNLRDPRTPKCEHPKCDEPGDYTVRGGRFDNPFENDPMMDLLPPGVIAAGSGIARQVPVNDKRYCFEHHLMAMHGDSGNGA